MKSITYLVILLLIITLCPKGYTAEGDRKNMKKQDTTCNKKQYDLLKRCSKNKDITEWNGWRKENSKEKIILTGADLSSFELTGVNLNSTNLDGANLTNANLREAQLFNTNISDANLTGANLEEAYLVETIIN